MPVVIIPIILTVLLGYLLERRRRMDVRSLSSVSIYVLLPSLIFYSMFTTQVTLHEALPLIVLQLLLFSALWLIVKGYAVYRRLESPAESFLMLTALFMNAGNMGMPVALYAFGQRGLDLAVIWVLALNAFTNLVAVYYASRHVAPGTQAVRTVFTLPAIYAAATALLLRQAGVRVPAFLLDPMQLIGRSVIPISQLLLGMQLAKVHAQVSTHLPRVVLPNVLRLAVSPLIAFGLAGALGLHGTAAKVAVLLAAMPTAINIAIYATEFDSQPRLVSTAVFTSTLTSFVTLPGLLVLLR
jgi:predicted permease